MKSVDVKSFVFGGTASVFAEFGTFPLDTAKTRLMVQGQHADGKILAKKYRGMLHAFYRITFEEGKTALFKGLSVALLRQATYGTIKIGIYESLKPTVSNVLSANTLPNNIVCAAIAGTVSSCLATPTDVLKVRQQTSGLTKAGKLYSGNLTSLFRTIYREEGLRGMWRGVGPTAQRATIVSTVQLPSYEAAKRFFSDPRLCGDSVATHLISSIVAGTASACACNPVDVIKNRMMNQHCRTSGSAFYVNSIDCLMKTVLTEGPAALWKGFIPNCMRLGPWNVIFFMTFEQMKRLNEEFTTTWHPPKQLDSVVAIAAATVEAEV